VPDTHFSHKKPALKEGWQKHLQARPPGNGERTAGGYELVFEPDPTIHDGRFANNGWLQELPKPITRPAWDNAALMSPVTAKELGVGLGSYAHGGEHGGYNQPVIELRLGDRKVRAPAWIVPGHADRCITISLGYGREATGFTGGNDIEKRGFNGYLLRTSAHPWFAPALTVQKTPYTHRLASTQQHQLMENRAPVRSGTLADFQYEPAFASREETEFIAKEQQRIGAKPSSRRKPLSLYRDMPPSEHRWDMIIDLTTCIGCSACVVACQAENNIPVVGKDQVTRGREMHWLRIDRYNSGPYDAPTEFHFQPVPCMHCENAPCEYVCPVEATVHSRISRCRSCSGSWG
jgi:molybdopterin-containing oxidoreductase family iron-sulfur binding subunit